MLIQKKNQCFKRAQGIRQKTIEYDMIVIITFQNAFCSTKSFLSKQVLNVCYYSPKSLKKIYLPLSLPQVTKTQFLLTISI